MPAVMKKLVLLLLLVNSFLVVLAQEAGDLVILYDNDVHCAVEGYPVIAGLRDSMEAKGCQVMVTSSGDFSFGGPIGAVSKGVFVSRLMNAVGYDAICLGNHEFDYGMAQLHNLAEQSTSTFLCSNLLGVDDDASLFAPFVLRYWGDKCVAFIGVTTPSTLMSSSPTTFQDSEGVTKYHFSSGRIADVVQRWVDAVRGIGADYVVVLSHLGDQEDESSVQLIQQTHGIDLVLDGHDHNEIPSRKVANALGRSVLLSSTGSKFRNIGMVSLCTDGSISSSLLNVKELSENGCCCQRVRDTLSVIMREFESLGNRVVAYCVEKQVAEENDVRVCRLRETNLGDLIADAYRCEMGTDVAIVNAGGIRANIDKGEVTHNMLYAVSPFGNQVLSITATGQEILDALENGVSQYPSAEGCFLQVSGISFSIDASIPSSVRFDSQGRFLSVDGPRRVQEVMINGAPLQPGKRYSIAGPSYILLEGGNGFVFPTSQLVSVSLYTDLQLLENYIVNHLSATIAAPYDATHSRINFLNKK